jgi:hypothetical protein
MSTMTEGRKKPKRGAKRRRAVTWPDSPWPGILRKLRENHGRGGKPLTQAQAAGIARLATRTWISYENRHRIPRGPALELLRIAFPQDIPAG